MKRGTTNLVNRNAAFVSAALCHVRDATHLVAVSEHQSIDQAFHLVGFGPECIRKACLDERAVDRALGHTLSEAGDPVVDFLVACDPEAVRYGVELAPGDLPLLRAAGWRPDVRYARTGNTDTTPGERRVAEIVEEAMMFVDERLIALWADGALDGQVIL